MKTKVNVSQKRILPYFTDALTQYFIKIMLNESPIKSREVADRMYDGTGPQTAQDRRLYEIISILNNLNITKRTKKGYNPTIIWIGMEGLTNMLSMIY